MPFFFFLAQPSVWPLCCTFSPCFWVVLCVGYMSLTNLILYVFMLVVVQQWSMYCLDFLLLSSRFYKPHFCLLVMMKPCDPTWMWQKLVRQSFFFWKSWISWYLDTTIWHDLSRILVLEFTYRVNLYVQQPISKYITTLL